MSGPRSGQVARFVRSAWLLLAFQLVAAAGATALTIWAAVEVGQVVEERDNLARRVVELEARLPGNQEDALAPDAPTAGEPQLTPGTTDMGLDNGLMPTERLPDEPAASEPGRAPEGDEPSEDSGEAPPPVPTTAPDPAAGATARSTTPTPTPPRRDCRDLQGRVVECVPPFRRVGTSATCVDGNRQRMTCPPGVPPATAPTSPARTTIPTPTTPTPTTPPARRDCRDLQGNAIVCAPPFRRVGTTATCIDANRQRMRCPASVPPAPSATSTPPPTTRTPTAPTTTRVPAPATRVPTPTTRIPTPITRVPTGPTTTTRPSSQRCRDVQGQLVECRPPFRPGPRPGLCYDNMTRTVRCPPGEPRDQVGGLAERLRRQG